VVGGEGVARRGIEAVRVRVPAVAGYGQSGGCCRVPLPLPGQWLAGRAAAIGVQTVSRSSRTAVGLDPGTPPRRPAFPTIGLETAAAAGSAPKIRFRRVLQHNTRTGARAHALSTRYLHVKLQNTYGVRGVARVIPTVSFNVHSSLFCVVCSCNSTIVCV